MQNKFDRDVFSIKEEGGAGGTGRLGINRIVELHPNLLRYDLHSRTAAVATALEDLRSKGVIRRCRDELFPIVVLRHC